MSWRFQPRDPNFGIPAGQVQVLEFLFVPKGTSLVTLLSFGETPESKAGPTDLALIDLGMGQEDKPVVDPVTQWQRVELAFMRFAARIACKHPPLMAARAVHPDLILRRVVGEHYEALRATRVQNGGRVRLHAYPIPAGDHRAVLLIRAGGSATS